MYYHGMNQVPFISCKPKGTPATLDADEIYIMCCIQVLSSMIATDLFIFFLSWESKK